MSITVRMPRAAKRTFWETSLANFRRMLSPSGVSVRQIRHQRSPILGREVSIDVYLPPTYRKQKKARFPLLIINDGQDLPRMDFADLLAELYQNQRIRDVVIVGVHCGPERSREYGTADYADYKGRGDRAAEYKSFILNELLPFLFSKFRLSGKTEETGFAGFSLGGLSAFDIAYDQSDIFGIIGVFSGALWWRSKPVDPRWPDADRILHQIVRTDPEKNDSQRFWFECGTNDEEDDRNNNGVIDAIDDTLDLIGLLQEKGYPDDDIRYIEIDGGTHDPETWGMAMPDFLIWAYSR